MRRALGLTRMLMLCATASSWSTEPTSSNFEAGAIQDGRSCSALARETFSEIPEAPAQVIAARRVEPLRGAPGYCQVDGYVAPQVGFQLRLPVNSWNGKLLEVGCGGHCGTISSPEWSACDEALSRGYACIASDMGHKGTGLDSLWARENLQARIDWGYRATHVAAIAGKAITGRFYARAPSRSYFMGCSTGGRQALQEAQRFPWDFDGIIAGAPPIRLSDLYVTFAWSQRATRDAHGRPLLSVSDLKLLTQAALKKCDMDDGVQDGIIGRPLGCTFRPSELQCHAGQTSGCLTPEQVTAAEKIYSGPTGRNGKPLFGGGALPGSEFGGAWNEEFGANWERYYLDKNGEKPYLYGLAEEGLAHLFFSPERNASWSLRDFDFDKDYKRLDVMESLYDSSNPDLSRFKARGGKLIIYMGLNDISMPRTVIDYYEKVERVVGGRKEALAFARLFTLPGVEHCGGGPGADVVDYLKYLEDWVEREQAPDKLIAYHLKRQGELPLTRFPPPKDTIEFSRPVYPYPTTARFLGKGDPKDANSFGPMEASEQLGSRP